MNPMEQRQPIVCFFVGLGAGAACGMLFTPRSGRQSRQMIRDGMQEVASQSRQGKDYVAARIHQLRDSAEALIDEGIETVAHQRDRVAAAVEAGKHALQA